MQLDIDYTHQNVKKENINNHFCKRSRSQIEIDEEKEKIDTSRKMAKWGIIPIPVYQNTRWWRFWRPNPVIMIKLSGLEEEDRLYQIKSMSTDIWYLIYWWVLRRIIRAIKRTRRKYKKFDFTYWDISNHSLINRRKLTFPDI